MLNELGINFPSKRIEQNQRKMKSIRKIFQTVSVLTLWLIIESFPFLLFINIEQPDPAEEECWK